MREFIDAVKALADETRVRILMSLSRGELCACQIVELMRLAPSTVSKHLSVLKQARFVDSRKEGRWMYFRFAEEDVPPESQALLELSLRQLADSPQIRKDAERLKQILKIDREILCRKQNRD